MAQKKDDITTSYDNQYYWLFQVCQEVEWSLFLLDSLDESVFGKPAFCKAPLALFSRLGPRSSIETRSAMCYKLGKGSVPLEKLPKRRISHSPGEGIVQHATQKSMSSYDKPSRQNSLRHKRLRLFNTP